jgi:23S rRNA (uracil1939-C5)-methyltransferase
MMREEEIVLEMEDFAAGGKSLARINGRVVFVPLTVPGDRVKARVSRVRKKYLEAEIMEVLEESSLRVAPQCSHFGDCGGCKWQQVGYPSQLEFKRQQVVDALERIGGFQNIAVSPVVGAESEYFYRNKMEFSFGPMWLSKSEFQEARPDREDGPSNLALGLHPSQLFSKVIDVQNCFLQSELSNRILRTVRRFVLMHGLDFYSTTTHSGYLRNLVIREGKRTGDVMVNLVTSEERPALMQEFREFLLAECPGVTTLVNNVTARKSQVALGDYERVYHGPGYIAERLGSKVFRVSANSFFQTNTPQAEKLYEAVVRVTNLVAEDVVYDLYCGTGTIAIFLGGCVHTVVGVDSVESAILDARVNAQLNGASNCFFETGDLKEMLTKDRRWIERHGPPSVVILDPPRSGAHEKVIREILNLAPDRIAYVSCNPATLARDLKLLCATGLYVIHEVQPVDMFPHTDHIECIAGLHLGSA